MPLSPSNSFILSSNSLKGMLIALSRCPSSNSSSILTSSITREGSESMRSLASKTEIVLYLIIGVGVGVGLGVGIIVKCLWKSCPCQITIFPFSILISYLVFSGKTTVYLMVTTKSPVVYSWVSVPTVGVSLPPVHSDLRGLGRSPKPISCR